MAMTTNNSISVNPFFILALSLSYYFTN